jgi:hypothetical protein
MDDSTLIISMETKSLELTNKFRMDAGAFEAKRNMVSSVAQISWIYGVLVVIGWNEAMTVLFNLVYISFLLIVLTTSLVFSILASVTFLTNFYSYIIVQLRMVKPVITSFAWSLWGGA